VSETPLPNEALEAWTRDCAFVISGRVQALGASNLDGVEPEDRMVTVEVEDVALAPRSLGDLRGQTITVYVESTEGLEEGQQLTFFGRSWHYGRTIGIVEVGRTATPAAEMRQAITSARLRSLEDQIEERIRGAEVIISGRVLATHRIGRAEGLPGFIEGVEWWTADLWIGSVEKGQPPEDQRIWFPEGGDWEWGPVPKAYPGQSGVWFLRPLTEPGEEDAEARGGRSRNGRGEERPWTGSERRLMAVDPLDYHAASDLPRIQTLLWRVSEG